MGRVTARAMSRAGEVKVKVLYHLVLVVLVLALVRVPPIRRGLADDLTARRPDQAASPVGSPRTTCQLANQGTPLQFHRREDARRVCIGTVGT